MLETLLVYLELGMRHILDLQGYDHILFVAALVAGEATRIRRLVLLVTAFTVGHSITLALATLDLLRADPAWVEFLIPVTIVITSGINVFSTRVQARTESGRALVVVRYVITLLFGLIHGLGFSNFLRAALGEQESLLWPLLGFNAGVELGQLAIVAVLLVAGWLAARWTPLRDWVLVLSGATGGIALIMALERIP